jgi:lactoylglutathione lyase
MKPVFVNLMICTVTCFFIAQRQDPKKSDQVQPLRLGNFSVSLNVKDIEASYEFYRKLGFEQVGGDLKQRWVVLKNENCKIGLFQGMFEKNSLTFNPGWDENKKTLKDFDDVRDIQRELLARGIAISIPAEEGKTGPAFIAFEDPDGNPILIDQHVPRPKKGL